MLAIRLTRTGKSHSPHFRIVVQEKRSKVNGSTIDIIGHYHPADKNKLVVLDKDKARKWIAQGAQPTDTVANILVRQEVLPETSLIKRFYPPKKTEGVVETPAPVAVVEETPAEEPVAEEELTSVEPATDTEVTPEEPTA